MDLIIYDFLHRHIYVGINLHQSGKACTFLL